MNETRLIDANALRTYIDEYIERRKLSEHERIVLEGFKRIIDIAPTVEAVQYTLGYQDGFLEGKKICERPHGKWIRTALYGKTCFECNNCHLHYDIISNFCSNCGADMRPEKKVKIPSCLTNQERQAELLERYKEE